MNTAGRNEDWTGPQLAARLATLEGAVPEPLAYLVCRHTAHANGQETQIFQTADEPDCFRQDALPAWLARHRLRGAERLGLALLIIRETVDETGVIRECTLERRRGALDGPLHGDPARVEFIGAARMVRFYRALRDGRLAEIAASSDTLPARHHAPDQLPGEVAAVHIHYGPDVRLIDSREPTLFEAMIGCDSILHARFPDGREIGCGIGWHGPVPFLLAADFPRFATPLALPPEDAAAVQAALLRDSLVPHETRLDAGGLAVVARRRGGEQLFLLRATAGGMALTPYEPAPEAVASADQASWMRYAETYEHLAILDAWRDQRSDDLLVISGEASGQIWRHHVDRDGVETWRKPDEEAAAGLLYRERLTPGTLAAADAAGAIAAPLALPDARPEPEPDADIPPDSLLAAADAYVTAMAALHDAESAAAGGAGAEVLECLRVLLPALDTLSAAYAAAETRRLLGQIEDNHISAVRLSLALARIAARLSDDLAATRLMTLAPEQWGYIADPAPFGRTVENAFAEAAYDIEEASFCLAYRRPTAAAFHCMRVIEAGLAAWGASLETDLLGEESRWTGIMASLRRAVPEQTAALSALDQVRRCWRGAHLAPARKYTEAEAERLFGAIGTFMQELAVVLQRQGGV